MQYAIASCKEQNKDGRKQRHIKTNDNLRGMNKVGLIEIVS